MNMFDEISLFDDNPTPFKIDKPIRLIELFGGIGTQAMSLEKINPPMGFEHYRLVEFDKYCIKSYNAIHGTNFEPMDITKVKGEDLGIVDTDKYCYMLVYSFPCTDLSCAGKMQGMSRGSGTRSGLLWEVERLLKELKNLPQVLIMENVTQVHGNKNRADFEEWLSFLDGLGYKNFWHDMNAKDYGVAQNRNRCFCVSLLGNYTYTFPEPIELKKCMKDYLEEEVGENYFIHGERAEKLISDFVENNKEILEGGV